jgi:hypothetical protein
MNEMVNYPAAVMFILKNMYFNECTFEPELDDEGNQKKDEKGRGIQKAKHESGKTFKQWCEQHSLIVSESTIINPNAQPLKIVKPNIVK